MRIEKLLPPPQPGKPWSVALEGGEVLRVSESVVASFALYGGMELEADIRRNFDKLMSNQSRIAAKAAGRAVDVSADDFEDAD